MSIAVHNNDLTLHLSELRNQLSDFLNTLQDESHALKKNNIEQLIEILSKKQSLSEHISVQTTQIETAFGLPSQLTELRQSCLDKKAKDCVELVDEIIQLSQECKDLNMRNGITIQAIENINAQMINIFTQPQEGSVSLYNASGEKKAANSKASLGKA
jgi:flagellar biosynthesis/type III secretory pathway chaperone